jgi:hypothetical protein
MDLTIVIGRSFARSDFGFRFLATMVILGRVRLHGSLTRTLPCRIDPDLSTALHAGSMKRLSEVVNQTLPMGMVYRFMRSHFRYCARCQAHIHRSTLIVAAYSMIAMPTFAIRRLAY